MTLQITDDWGSGFNGRITVKNSDATAWKSWTLQFDYADRVDPGRGPRESRRRSSPDRKRELRRHRRAGRDGELRVHGEPQDASAGPANYVMDGGGPTSHRPLAQNDTAWTAPGQAVTIPVLANDSDPDGDTLAIASVAQGQHGAVVVEGRAIIYTPDPGFTGSDSFAYTIRDGRGGSVVASAALTVSSLTWPTHVFAPYVDMGLYPT